MTDSVKFFNTQIQMLSGRHPNNTNLSVNALEKLKQLKQQARQLDSVYKRALSSKTKTQKSISTMHKSAQKIRVDFLKFYENKKIKLMNRQKWQNFLVQQKQYQSKAHQNTKQKKLIQQYQLASSKSQENEHNLNRIQRNKKDKSKLKKQIKIKNLQAFMFAKSQYNKIKDQRQTIIERNQKISQILSMRSHINYAQKIQKQLSQIHQYQDLLKMLEQNEQVFDGMKPTTVSSRSFFITSRKTNTTKSTRGGTTQGSRVVC